MAQDRYPHGAVKAAVHEWVDNLPVGREFHYTEAADELDVQRPSVSGILLKMARTDPQPAIVFGSRSGQYVRVEPRTRPELEQIAIDTGRMTQAKAKAPDRREPMPPQADDVMAVIGSKRDGTVLLKDEYGALWEANPV